MNVNTLLCLYISLMSTTPLWSRCYHKTNWHPEFAGSAKFARPRNGTLGFDARGMTPRSNPVHVFSILIYFLRRNSFHCTLFPLLCPFYFRYGGKRRYNLTHWLPQLWTQTQRLGLCPLSIWVWNVEEPQRRWWLSETFRGLPEEDRPPQATHLGITCFRKQIQEGKVPRWP